jgi:hypothetical protein
MTVSAILGQQRTATLLNEIKLFFVKNPRLSTPAADVRYWIITPVHTALTEFNVLSREKREPISPR